MASSAREKPSDIVKKYYAQGLLEGEALGQAKAVLVVLAARSVSFTPEERERIASCTDLAKLERWVRRAATCKAVDELFAD
ncbi:MAG TPA: hypothetical protein VFS43_18565 [Polyangiaceae bacterium]|nr:hypothetical protein [Polyangiaceae bacterium]